MKINTPNVKTIEDCQRMFMSLKNSLEISNTISYKDIVIQKAEFNEIMYTNKWDGSMSVNKMVINLIGNRCFIDGYLRVGAGGTTGTNNKIYIKFPYAPNKIYYNYNGLDSDMLPKAQGKIKNHTNATNTNNGYTLQSSDYPNSFYFYDDTMNTILDYSDIDLSNNRGIVYKIDYLIDEGLL